MQVYESLSSASLTGPTALTIGNFDGVHRGHGALIRAMAEAAAAEGAASGLLTFHPHPRAVLQPTATVSSLTSLHERLDLLSRTGLDFTVVHPFTRDTAQTEAAAFLHALRGHLGLTSLWVGPDFALGKGRQGDVPFLRQLGAEMGIRIEVVPEFQWEGQPVRSSHIRQWIELGNVAAANVALGRRYAIPGVVVHGAERGRTIGFPTANLSLAGEQVIPAHGVYATWAHVGGERLPAVTNIGVRPTVNGSHRTVEAHIIDFDQDIYGRCLRLEFVDRLRDEMKFPSLAALTAQIARDRDQAAHLLAAEPALPTAPRFQELAYTADWGVAVYGDSQAALYAHAALAMFTLQGAADVDGPTVRQQFAIAAEDRESLLVCWLNELLWQAETQGVFFQQFWVEAIDDVSLRAQAVGRRGRSEQAHIKAVTYHDLEVLAPTQPGESWKARVLFDT
ncbi:MAG: bifunctional riboflavin kinase/FAD synthetase [Caldilineales bacterium]|nr:bifunctional riboflavin kinase/FAD synthetase [Caldilineales bacterium]